MGAHEYSSIQLQKVAKMHHLDLIVLFGSVVRDQARQDSDVDIGVLANQPVSPSQLAQLWGELSSIFDLIVEIASEINRHIIEAANQASPKTYYSTFEEMGRLRVLPSPLAGQLASTTGLRNRLVHGYEKVQHEIVHRGLKTLLRHYKTYFVAITDYLDAQAVSRAVSRAESDENPGH